VDESDRTTRLLAEIADDARLSLGRVALILDCAYPTVKRYVDRGYLLAIRIGGRFEVTGAELKRFYKFGNATDSPNLAKPLEERPLYTAEGVSLERLSPEKLEELGFESTEHSPCNAKPSSA
jgi:hypothetical protein